MTNGEKPRVEQWDEPIKQKLDRGLRKLLDMTDEDIREQVTQSQRRLAERLDRIKQLSETLAPNATSEDREAVARVQRLQRRELLPDPIFGPVIVREPDPIRIRAVVRFTGNRNDLTDLGLQIRSQAQDVFTIVGTRDQLADLVFQPACRRLRLPRVLARMVEDASAQAEIAAVHTPRPLNPTGYEGNGVIIAVLDSPLDVTHHGFRQPTGIHGTRLLYYWVQMPQTLDVLGQPQTVPNPPGQTPEQFHLANLATTPNFIGLNYGRIYTRAAIDTALGLANPYGNGATQICCEPEVAEHGTHCAGIAVGSGHQNNWNSLPVHRGAAPQATMLHVQLEGVVADIGIDATFEDNLLDAIDFSLRATQFHNMPVVISTSQGTNFGPHNGWDDFDLARDNFLNSFDERSIVFASGNDNNKGGYRRGAVAAGATESFTMTARSSGVWLDIWYDGPELDYEISVAGSSSGWRTGGQDYTGTLNGRSVDAARDIETGGGLHAIRFYSDCIYADVFMVQLRNPSAASDAHYRAWVGVQAKLGSLSGATRDETTLADTACARSVLTVGACGKLHPPTPASGETITDYSGAGSTADGRIKPEIVAIGGTATDQVMSTNSDRASGYVGMTGTSMATPLVAGAEALLLEEYRSLGYHLNQDTLKALLTQHANRSNLHIDPADAAYKPEDRNRYGLGRLRLLGPIDLVRPPVDVDLWVRTAEDDYGDEPYIGGCFCGAPDIRVCHADTNNETTQIAWGTTYDVKVTVRNLGDTNAVGSTVRLKYTPPHAAPTAWHDAEDANNHKCEETNVNVPAMDQIELVFHWRPEAAEIGAPAGTTHFCLLAEIDHQADPLTYPAPTAGGGSAWATNIKGTNNVALRNLFIQ